MKTKNPTYVPEESTSYFHSLNDRELSLWLLKLFRDKIASPLSADWFHNSRSDVMFNHYMKMRKEGNDELCKRVEEAVAEMFLQYPANENDLIKDHPSHYSGFLKNMIRFMHDIKLLEANKYVRTKVLNYAYRGNLIPPENESVPYKEPKDNHLLLLRIIYSIDSIPSEDKIKLVEKYSSHPVYSGCENILKSLKNNL